MEKASKKVKLIINLAKTQAIISNRFDCRLGGLGFSEFLILYHLSLADDYKLRRVDLADKIGMTASGITRLLLPMEKIGLIKSGPSEVDARVRSVILASGGKQKLIEALERIELLVGEIMAATPTKKVDEFFDFITEIGGRALMN